MQVKCKTINYSSPLQPGQILLVGFVRILPRFQEEMIVQEDLIKLEKTIAWSRRNKSRRSRLVHCIVD